MKIAAVSVSNWFCLIQHHYCGKNTHLLAEKKHYATLPMSTMANR